MDLNPEQRTAVKHGEGPMLVIAGPGSGKTSVITGRIVHLLAEVRSLRAENVLALTYTKKAAEEMKARVSAALGDPPELPRISTFHSLCEQILTQNHTEHRLLDKIDVWIFLRRRMEQLGLEFYQKLAEPGAFLHGLNDFFSRCQDELIEPEDFEAYVREAGKAFAARAAQLDPAELEAERIELEKKKELARVFRVSRRLIEEAGCSSLGSLIAQTIHLFDLQPHILEKYRGQFQYFLVDEFQDTNFGQVELLRRLVSPPQNITAVGDDDQAIYRFRGASHGAFAMFGRVFPGHKTVYLHRNYRSTRRILRCADAVIGGNDHEIRKPPLTTEKDEGSKVFLVESGDSASEAAWVAGEIKRLVSRGNSYRDVAVLYRAHLHRDQLVEELRRREIPFAIRGLSLLSSVILRDLVAYLKLIDSPRDNISLTRVLLQRHWRFGEELAYSIRQRAAERRCSIFDAIENSENAGTGKALAGTNWAELKKLLADLKQSAEHASMVALWDELTARLGLHFLEGDSDRVPLESFRKFLGEWEAKSETRKLREFIDYFGYFVEAGGEIEAPEPPPAANAVRLMTVHAAKGLEFPAVFILSVAARRFPTIQRKPVIDFPEELRRGPEPPPDLHAQEERRLFFVAMTRAKDRLYVSSIAKVSATAKGRKKVSELVEDLISDPAVRAGDIETIEAPTMAGEESPRAAAETIMAASSRHDREGLFEGPLGSDCIHPPLADWARRSPTNVAANKEEKIRLSATAVETYLECPLKFKFSHLLKIPTGPQAALTFGNIMHRSVRSYFEILKNSEPSFEEIEKVYLDSWRSAGFEDAYQEETYKKAGMAQLRQFVEKQKSCPVAPQGIKLEEHFALDCGDLVLEGRIDQINPLAPSNSAGNGKPARAPAVELIDYKTGRPRPQKDADKSLQLSVYALAAERQLKMDPARLTFYFLTTNETVSTVRTAKNLDATLEEIREVAGQIRQMNFEPTPGFVCKWCDFMPICPAHEGES